MKLIKKIIPSLLIFATCIVISIPLPSPGTENKNTEPENIEQTSEVPFPCNDDIYSDN